MVVLLSIVMFGTEAPENTNCVEFTYSVANRISKV